MFQQTAQPGKAEQIIRNATVDRNLVVVMVYKQRTRATNCGRRNESDEEDLGVVFHCRRCGDEQQSNDRSINPNMPSFVEIMICTVHSFDEQLDCYILNAYSAVLLVATRWHMGGTFPQTKPAFCRWHGCMFTLEWSSQSGLALLLVAVCTNEP